MQSSSLSLKKQADRRLKKGHLWIYSNEVDTEKSPLKAFAAGDFVDVVSAGGQFLGKALVNPNALICGRLVTREKTAHLNAAFFKRRLTDALRLREMFFHKPYYRLVYGDADLLPGVVIDRFGDYFVVQLTTAGMDKAQQPLLDTLQSMFNPTAIILRNDHGGRELESLPEEVVCIGQVPEKIALEENGTAFEFAALTGQKTGWFYDHRINRQQVQAIAHGKRVLDVFSYIGGWGIEAATAGATEVMCVDASQSAIDLVEHNAQLNNVGANVVGVRGKTIEALKTLLEAREKFDLVILDPPAFIKKRKDQKAGEAAYRHINELGIRLLNPDGILVSASCSMPLSEEALTDIVRGAARKHDRHAQLVYAGSQGMDHPVHPAIPETRYIKAQFYRISHSR